MGLCGRCTALAALPRPLSSPISLKTTLKKNFYFLLSFYLAIISRDKSVACKRTVCNNIKKNVRHT